MGLLRYVTPSGALRRWTLKQIVQGRPLGHPSHTMFVHFPVAFYIGALGFDLASRAARLPQAPIAATWMILAAFAGSVPAGVTGLVDWWGMKPRSRTRRVANRHLLFQVAAAACFAAVLALRWADRARSRAETTWIVLEGIGVAALTVGQYLGGVLVYQIGFRVYESKPPPKAEETRST